MADDYVHVTPEEVLRSYHFKVAKNILKLNYPFIKNVVLDSEGKEINKYNLIFLSLYLDKDKVSEYFGAPLHRWVEGSLSRGETFYGVSFSIIVEISREESDRVREEMNKLLYRIGKSSSLPEDLRLPAGRNFSVIDYYIFPDGGQS